MNITHLGNGIVQFDNVIKSTQQDVDKYLENLLLSTNHEGYSNLGNENLKNSGGYNHNLEQAKIAPHRYLNVNHLGIEKKDFQTLSDLEDSGTNCVSKYLEIFPSAAGAVKWRTRGHVIRYLPGQMIGPHSDANLPYADDGLTPISLAPIANTLTCSIFLNDKYTGGNLCFRPWGITVFPKFGSIVVYPSNFSGCHEITPIETGERFAYLSWFCHGVLDISPPAEHKRQELQNFSYHLDFITSHSANSVQQFVPVGPIK